ncbi:phosphoglucomutase/phosphomannomutase, alpha/beta/alpha domain III family protein [Mycobacterium xenopi 4042]|uniref:Phosphoglucomutase/phosphomannomutase, alpha/beta/alpha domain III family protein n=1 Tax=Mycobacterium xenopi 4042 TaxID=1299334 RepID=X7YJC8_MYCXE|nr:phosphoglucomutase/phosphomannomutase, alpha/beta/alpha domain III family protein [Mycobacterium xenopi 4042]
MSHTDSPTTAVVASTVVSSRMLAAVAARHGARHVETLTGFKWLARADAGLPGCRLVYAYEEAIGHCVDPDAVRDKDGISAAVVACDLVAALNAQGRSVLDMLDELARRHGVHVGAAVSSRWPARRGGGNHAAAAARATRPAGWICRLHNGFTAPHRRAGVFWQRRPHVGPGGGATVGHRTQAEVLPRSRLPAERGSSACS